jgi:hypothetical protein
LWCHQADEEPPVVPAMGVQQRRCPKTSFLTSLPPAPIGMAIALTSLVHTRMEVLVESSIRLHDHYSDWVLPAQPSERSARYDRPDTGAYLIVIALLSLGIWAGIWAAASLASAVLG